MAEQTSITETSRVAATLERAVDNSRVVSSLCAPFRQGSRPVRAAQWSGDVVRGFVPRPLAHRRARGRRRRHRPPGDVDHRPRHRRHRLARPARPPDVARLDSQTGSRPDRDRVPERPGPANERRRSGCRRRPHRALPWGAQGTVSLVAHLFVGALAIAGLRVDWTLEELKASKVGRLAAALFVPPKPPDDED